MSFTVTNEPTSHYLLRRAVEGFDEAQALAVRGHQLLAPDATIEQVHEAAGLLSQAGFTRLEAVRDVRLAWTALRADTSCTPRSTAGPAASR